MSGLFIEFSVEDGLIFWKESSEGKKIVHKVETDTLKSMSLSDLDYCISTNVFLELRDAHDLFRDYLWSEDGEISPRKMKDEPR